ncbi:MAG: ABC transporter permease [Propionibacteriales bacterium]|nr:ABC transporter permease [Propionibacteriales bacterium]
MSVVSSVTGPSVPPPTEEVDNRKRLAQYLLIGIGAFLLVSAARVITGAHDIDSAGALRGTIVAAVPIALAGLGGIWSERAGVVNIGLEGMLVLGALGAGYFGYNYGIVAGVLGGMLLGLLGAAVHALATVVFGVDHIVSGVAINIMAPGLAAYLAKSFFSDTPGGGPTQSPPLGKPPALTIDVIAEPAAELADKHWFVVSDLAAAVAAVTREMSVLTLLALVLVVATSWVLWRTAFGLRLRSVGEAPSAAESLGVNVYLYKVIGVVVSGVLAGFGGAYLATVSSSGYQNGMVNGLGYIGLAAMIFGNWRPGLMLAGAALFGYTRTLQLRGGTDSLHALLLVIAVALLAYAVYQFLQGKRTSALITGGFGGVFGVWFLVTDSVPAEFTGMAPYVATLFVLAFFSQSLRPPKADGQIYRKGSAG